MNKEESVLNYKPQPVDVSDVILESPLMELSEVLAENVHDTWSARRMSQGWSYGKVRDDGAKLHPGLVPYSELTEKEKDYDRLTAMNTLRLVVKLGYTISRREE